MNKPVLVNDAAESVETAVLIAAIGAGKGVGGLLEDARPAAPRDRGITPGCTGAAGQRTYSI